MTRNTQTRQQSTPQPRPILRSPGLRLAALFALALCPLAAAAQAEPAPQQRYIEIAGVQEFSGQLIARPHQMQHWIAVGLDERAASQRIDAARTIIKRDFEVRRHVWQTDEYIFYVPGGETENSVAERLLATGDFQYVEPNWIVYPVGNVPNDPLYNQQWHHTLMESAAGWALWTGGPEVTVGICDTGIRITHEDLQLHRKEGYNAVDELWESVGGQIGELYQHGTSVTGCAAANSNNGKGVAGVGWNLSHRMLRVSNSWGGGSSIEVLNHAARTAIEAGDRVANVSYSGVSAESNRTNATYIKSIGGLLVWAAGNANSWLNWGDRDDDDIIVVGATDNMDNKAWFSNYGPSVDLVAPGDNVYTVGPNSNSDYLHVGGTSFAAPHVSGLVALIWSANPNLTPDEVEYILKQSCDDLGAPGVDNTFGYGRINVRKAMEMAVDVPDIPGDLNGDGCVDQEDLAILLAAYGSVPGDAHWNPDADLTNNDAVGHGDLAVLLTQWGEGC